MKLQLNMYQLIKHTHTIDFLYILYQIRIMMIIIIIRITQKKFWWFLEKKNNIIEIIFKTMAWIANQKTI